jgi:hypothetical protein
MSPCGVIPVVASALILVFSAALLLFYLQAACEAIVRREFAESLAHQVIEGNKLIFPQIRRALEMYDASVDCAPFPAQLNRDFAALIHLLRNAGTQRRRLSGAERTGAIYFRTLSGLLTVCRLFGLKGRPLMLKMTSVLEFFANVLGERTRRVRFGQLTPAEQPSVL